MDGVVRILASVVVLFACAGLVTLFAFADGKLDDADGWILMTATPVAFIAAIVFYIRFPSILTRFPRIQQKLQNFPTSRELSNRSAELSTRFHTGGSGRLMKWWGLQIFLIMLTFLPVMTEVAFQEQIPDSLPVERARVAYVITVVIGLFLGLRVGAFGLLFPGLWYSEDHWVRNRILCFTGLIAAGAAFAGLILIPHL